VPGGIALHLPYNKSMALAEMLSDTAYKYNSDRALIAIHNTSKQTQQKVANQTATTVYTVRRGDNLGAIAKRYSVSVAEIKKWNKLSSNNISAGKKLTIKRG
jgi:membrane-bound lytic murein transglycosylase D